MYGRAFCGTGVMQFSPSAVASFSKAESFSKSIGSFEVGKETTEFKVIAFAAALVQISVVK